jgi:hypothetical protein
LCLCVLLSSTILIMRDGEGKVPTVGNMFYNTLSARQALRRHRHWSRRRSSTPTFVPASLLRLLRRRQYPDVVSGTDLLPLPATNLRCIDIHRRRQADRSTTMPNTLRGMYLLTTALRGMWGRSNWHPISGMKELYLADCFCPHYWTGLICTWKFIRI